MCKEVAVIYLKVLSQNLSVWPQEFMKTSVGTIDRRQLDIYWIQGRRDTAWADLLCR